MRVSGWSVDRGRTTSYRRVARGRVASVAWILSMLMVVVVMIMAAAPHFFPEEADILMQLN